MGNCSVNRWISETLATSLPPTGDRLAILTNGGGSRGAEVGQILLEEAKTSGADLLVMGAYGHSRFREWVLGGATESALDQDKIPVLLSH